MKMKHKITVISAFAALMMFYGCTDEDSTGELRKKPQSLASAENVRVKFTENGILQAILYANILEDREKLTWAWHIRVEFFTDTNTIPDGGMVADSGFVREGRGINKREVQVFGNVELTAPDGTELYSDSLRWNPRTQEIESGSKVKVIRSKEIIHGVGFKSDMGFEHIRIVDVKGRLEEL